MCVPIETEKAAKVYMNALAPSCYARSVLSWAKQEKGWLLDYDDMTCRKVKPVTGKPGMKVINASIREATKTMVKKLATVE